MVGRGLPRSAHGACQRVREEHRPWRCDGSSRGETPRAKRTPRSTVRFLPAFDVRKPSYQDTCRPNPERRDRTHQCHKAVRVRDLEIRWAGTRTAAARVAARRVGIPISAERRPQPRARSSDHRAGPGALGDSWSLQNTQLPTTPHRTQHPPFRRPVRGEHPHDIRCHHYEPLPRPLAAPLGIPHQLGSRGPVPCAA